MNDKYCTFQEIVLIIDIFRLSIAETFSGPQKLHILFRIIAFASEYNNM